MSHAQKPSGLAAGNQQKTGLKNWLAKRPSAFTFMLIVLVSLVVGSINPNFWQLATLFDMVRSSVVLGLFALGCCSSLLQAAWTSPLQQSPPSPCTPLLSQ